MSTTFLKFEAVPASRLREERIARAAGEAAEGAAASARSRQILRFRKSERVLHWSIAIPFMVCYASALVLLICFNLRSQEPARVVVSWMHRVAGACLIGFPLLTVLRNRGDYRIHLYNIRQALTWAFDDVRWLALMGAAAVSSRVKLPDQGKFNAAEKINFIMVMSTYPVFIVTGVLLSVLKVAFLSWIVHVAMAAVATPLILGHVYMAVVNPGTRAGLSGMLSGYVDRQWAKHHYTRWYRENFEKEEGSGERPLRRPALVHCPGCGAEVQVQTWVGVLQALLQVKPFCSASCSYSGKPLLVVEPDEIAWMQRGLEQTGLGNMVDIAAAGAAPEQAAARVPVTPSATLQFGEGLPQT
jgi:formate dehydrogenase gamma subunit